MHNSQNSASSKASFASTVLAQAILLDIPTPSNAATSNEIQAISNSIISKIEQKTNTSVSEAPTFHPIKGFIRRTSICVVLTFLLKISFPII
jgi:hypothetical protein